MNAGLSFKEYLDTLEHRELYLLARMNWLSSLVQQQRAEIKEKLFKIYQNRQWSQYLK